MNNIDFTTSVDTENECNITLDKVDNKSVVNLVFNDTNQDILLKKLEEFVPTLKEFTK